MDYIEALAPGERVSVRELSARLGVSEGTAYKAVKDAEQRGLVAIKPKAGTVRLGVQAEDLEAPAAALDAVRLLGLTVAAGKAVLEQKIRRLIVCDGSEQSLLRQLNGQAPEECLCLCGDRPELHAAVLAAGANLLLTGGAKVSPSLVKAAEQAGRYILSSSLTAYSLVRLFDAEYASRTDLSGRQPVGDWMQTPDYLYYNDIIADWQRLYSESGMPKQYPIVDDDLEIYGGLDIWKAAAAVPSQKLSSQMAELPSLPHVSVHDDIRDAARNFVLNGDGLAAVLDGRRMVGILTANDLLRYYMFSGSAPAASHTDLFFAKEPAVLGRDVMTCGVRIPESELKNSRHIALTLLLSAAGDHLHRLGLPAYRIESGTFFSAAPVLSSEGLILTSRVQRQTGSTYVIETEINDDNVSYAKAVLIASGDSGEER